MEQALSPPINNDCLDVPSEKGIGPFGSDGQRESDPHRSDRALHFSLRVNTSNVTAKDMHGRFKVLTGQFILLIIKFVVSRGTTNFIMSRMNCAVSTRKKTNIAYSNAFSCELVQKPTR